MADFAPTLLLIFGAIIGAIFDAAFDKEPVWPVFWTLLGGIVCGLSQTNWLVGRILLGKGAVVNAKSLRGDTALRLGSKKGHTDIVRLINQYT